MGVSLMPRAIIDQRGLRESVGVHAVPRRYGKVQTVLAWRRDAEPLAAREAFLAVLQAGMQRTAPDKRKARARHPAS
jgi:hypothetical protein